MLKILQNYLRTKYCLLHVAKLRPCCISGMRENLALLSPICRYYRRELSRGCDISSFCLLKHELAHMGNNYSVCTSYKKVFCLVYRLLSSHSTSKTHFHESSKW